MLSRLHNRLGTAGFAVAILALIAAVGGTALAATGLNSQQKKEVKKIAKQYAGKEGQQGPPGAQGATGPQGPAGKDGSNGSNGVSPKGTEFSGEANGCKEGGVKFEGVDTTIACNGVKGAKGTNGTNGTNGINGEDGKSVETDSATAEECAQGGATVQVENEPSTKVKICNGQTGFTETLPVGKTETGAFAFSGLYAENQSAQTGIAFAIPLAAALDGAHVHVVVGTEEMNMETGALSPAVSCLGSVANPTAPSGELCVYERIKAVGTSFPGPIIQKLSTGFAIGADVAGANLSIPRAAVAQGTARANGTWAVTG